MLSGVFQIPRPANEPALDYAPDSPERESLVSRLREMLGHQVEVPMIIGPNEVAGEKTLPIRCPHDHRHVLGRYHAAGAEHVEQAIRAATEARAAWSRMPWGSRATIFLKAAELLAGKYRFTANAAAMLNLSKTAHQAEIDAACELIDFWRFNPYYMQRVYADQPFSGKEMLNYVEYRPLDGFVLAVTPFNFASIAGNLPTAPAMMGNTVVWKPASSAVLPAHYIMQVLREAGLPPGVINLVPGPGSVVGPAALGSRDLAGVHFTGSTATFASIWREIGADIRRYIAPPRIVGETGGKDFIFAHASADVDALTTALIRGAFEYQGQKCSAVSRAYIPDSLWRAVKVRLLGDLEVAGVGDVTDLGNFMGAVINAAAFANIRGYLQFAQESPDLEIVAGGECDDRTGYFIEPTVVVSRDPKSKLMVEEIFGPVLTVYVYPESEFQQTLDLCDGTSVYALTGAIFADDRAAIVTATDRLRHAAGNFYINDKPTGAVVGQQPFGGSRASGTNDKAGSALNLQRWVSARTIKETFVPPTDFRYPYMA